MLALMAHLQRLMLVLPPLSQAPVSSRWCAAAAAVAASQVPGPGRRKTELCCTEKRGAQPSGRIANL